MNIFRIQNKHGFGPYKMGPEKCFMTWWDTDHDDRIPDPYYDKIIDHNRTLGEIFTEKHYFGFVSLNQLVNWFSFSELEKLYELNYFCVELETLKIIASENQCIFIPKHHTKKTFRKFLKIEEIFS